MHYCVWRRKRHRIVRMIKRQKNGTFAPNSNHLIKHGMAKTPIYNLYRAMRDRCENPKNVAYENYGGRGIKVCEKWTSFEGFYEDMGLPSKGMTLDRIDNELGYSKENCRWASRTVQSRNRRGLKRFELNGKSQLICEWSEEVGIPLQTIWARIAKGWTVEKSITTPVRKSPRWHKDC